MTGEDATVEFSVKELLSDIRVDLREISGKLSSKADALDLLSLAGRVTDLEKTQLTQEAIKSNATQARNARMAAYGALIVTLGVLVSVLALFA